MPLTHVKREEPAANRRIQHDILSVRSLIEIRNSNGPNTEPWGTPACRLGQ